MPLLPQSKSPCHKAKDNMPSGQRMPRSRPASPSFVQIDGLPISRCTSREIVHQLIADGNSGGVLATVNLQFLALARRDTAFKKLLLSCRYLVADGMPLVWASRIAGNPLPSRVDGVGLVNETVAAASRKKRSVFLIGGRAGTAQASAATWMQKYPELKIAGIRCPPMGFDQDSSLLRIEIDAIADAAPNIVFVALGCPRQEQFAIACHQRMPQTWFIGVGGSFEFTSQHTVRAPRLIQKLGFEWLHRLLHEPRRLAHRYLIECLPVGVSILLRSTYCSTRQIR
jgi:N-acetylglucosaminyldiphosphoundecaprenol N-acetyl-beta-D-mannosaminyltransferase